MMQSQFDFALAAPEIFLTVMGMLILVLDAFSQAPRRTLAYGLSLATLAVLFLLSAWQWSIGLVGESFFGPLISRAASTVGNYTATERATIESFIAAMRADVERTRVDREPSR